MSIFADVLALAVGGAFVIILTREVQPSQRLQYIYSRRQHSTKPTTARYLDFSRLLLVVAPIADLVTLDVDLMPSPLPVVVPVLTTGPCILRTARRSS